MSISQLVRSVLSPAPVALALQTSAKVASVCQELGPNAHALPSILEPEDALELSAPALQRPVLFIHGLAQQADSWVNVKNFLCGNPANGYGGVLRADQGEQDFLLHHMGKVDSKVFLINLTDNLAAPQDNYQEVQTALARIREMTGCQTVDIVTHSLGALNAREALRHEQPGGIGNLIMIAPPNQGAYGANLLLDARKVGYDRYDGKTGALEALRLEKGPLGGNANEWLHDLNLAWQHDSQNVQPMIISGIGLPTPDRSLTLTSLGDGMVATDRMALGDTPIYIAGDNGVRAGEENFRDFQMFRYNHLQILSEPEVFQMVGQTLARPLPGQPQAGEVDSRLIYPGTERPADLGLSAQLSLF